MAINLFPLRLGEVTRPLLLRKRHAVPFPTGIATVAAERIFDALFVAAILGIGVLNLPKDSGEPSMAIIRSTGITALMIATMALFS